MTRSEYPPITNTPEGILSAWTALEVLSPPTFTRPEELALNRWDVVQLGEKLPWESGAKSKPSYKLYFQVILGTVKLEPAVARLIERYADTRPDPPSTRDKKAILAAVIVDRAGRLIESPAVAVSSFAWGVMTALNGDLADLARWPIAERDLVEKIDAKLRTFTSGEESERPLTHEALLKTYQALVDELRLPQEFVEPPTFAIRSYVWFKDPNPPEPVILNSFFLADLDRARREFADGRASENLQRYLGSISPETRIDLLQDEDALREVIAPTHTPIGRWPSRGRRSLVMLQQAAVNLAFKDLHDGAILGVNGPPGTGKTTLLRDVVAGAVPHRAAAMVKFADPETAFTHSGERVKAGQSWLHLYSLVPELRGHEIVVASSNNKAVENVSAELPALSAIAADAPDLRYFKCVADVAHDRETWGMIAAVLGNAQNRGRFRRTFWWDEEVGMSRYLAAAAGTPQVIEEKDAATGTIKTRLPRVVAEERPPTSKQQALKQWKAARTRFKNAVEESRRWQAWLENLRRIERDLPRLTHAVSDAEGRRTLARAQKSAADMRVAAAERERQVVEASRVAQWSPLLAAIGEIAASVIIGENVARVTAQEAQRARLAADDAVLSARTILNAHAMRRPGLWARTFNTRAFQHWNATAGELTQALATAQTAAANTYATVAARESEVSAAAALRQESERTYLAAEKVVKGDHSSFSSVLANRYADTLRQSAQTAFYADSLNPFLANCRAADDAVAAADRRLAECRDQVVRAGELLEAAERDVRVAQAADQTAMASLDEAGSPRVIIPNKACFAAGEDAVHGAPVWYPHEAQRGRDEVFSPAIAVLRAFIGAAAKPLRHNLGALISNQGLTTERKRTLIPDLWASLFLVVPMVSTTFASVERMLHDLPPQSLGWLLVDEAGQALPQAAVGALMRTRKALVIGDPMQIRSEERRVGKECRSRWSP